MLKVLVIALILICGFSAAYNVGGDFLTVRTKYLTDAYVSGVVASPSGPIAVLSALRKFDRLPVVAVWEPLRRGLVYFSAEYGLVPTSAAYFAGNLVCAGYYASAFGQKPFILSISYGRGLWVDSAGAVSAVHCVGGGELLALAYDEAGVGGAVGPGFDDDLARRSVVVAAFDAELKRLWAKRVALTWADRVSALAAGGGVIFVVGSMRGEFAGVDTFVLAVTSNGAVVGSWALDFGANQQILRAKLVGKSLYLVGAVLPETDTKYYPAVIEAKTDGRRLVGVSGWYVRGAAGDAEFADVLVLRNKIGFLFNEFEGRWGYGFGVYRAGRALGLRDPLGEPRAVRILESGNIWIFGQMLESRVSVTSFAVPLKALIELDSKFEFKTLPVRWHQLPLKLLLGERVLTRPLKVRKKQAAL